MTKTNGRSEQTKLKIERTMLALLQKEKLSDITVQQILSSVPVAKSTFYAHYYDKFDVLEKIVVRYEQQFDQLLEQRFATLNFSELSSLISSWHDLLSQDSEELTILLSISIENANLTNGIQSIFKKHLLHFLERHQPQFLMVVPVDYIAEVMSHAALGSLKWHIKNGANESIYPFIQSLQEQLLKVR